MELVGDFDNGSAVGASPSRRRYAIHPLQRDWILLGIAAGTDGVHDLVLPLKIERRQGQRPMLVPHATNEATARLDEGFNASSWTPLQACSLLAQGVAANRWQVADTTRCLVVSTVLGQGAGLLPVDLQADRDRIVVRELANHGGGSTALIQSARVRWFSGWVALLGGGNRADAGSSDWHVNRGLRIGNEGGRAPIRWRDGVDSGYALRLERVTEPNGNTRLLKLSVVDAGGQVVAYAWSNENSDRIGLSLGWIQVGLAVEGVPAARSVNQQETELQTAPHHAGAAR